MDNSIHFCAITPTRGDRSVFVEQLKKQVARMTIQPAKHFIIDYKPIRDEVDIVQRIQFGLKVAASEGFDNVFVLEDDDYYPADYFEGLMEMVDFYGEDKTVYYNLINRTSQVFEHDGRSSLFTTGFKLSALNGFIWPRSTDPFLDIALWKFARHKSVQWRNTEAVGIKHGIGKTGGKGHRMDMSIKDKRMEVLSKMTGADFPFYKNLSDRLC